MKVDKLEIPIIGNFGEIKLCIYPALGSSMLFEEEDAVDYGESRWQLQEGCTYEYELVSDNGHCLSLKNVEWINTISLRLVECFSLIPGLD